MSDSFADLWNSAAPSNPSKSAQNLNLGALSASNANSRTGTTYGNPRYVQNDLFAQLSSAGNSRSGTPSLGGSSITNANTNAARLQTKPMPSSSRSSSNGSGGDAFSGLFGDNTSLSVKSTKNMTIAERAALAEKERRSQLLGRQQMAQQVEKGNSAWDGLDALGSKTSSSSSFSSPAQPSVVDDDDWGLGFGASSATDSGAGTGFVRSTAPSPPSKAVSATASTLAVDDDWGLGDFGSAPKTNSASRTAKAEQAKTTSGAGSLWDLDELTSGNGDGIGKEYGSKGKQGQATTSRHDSPSQDFDFGNREDDANDLIFQDSSGGNRNGEQDNNDDDILGVLGKPVESVRAQVHSTPSSQPKRTTTRSRTSSPPPHVLGQLVEMGFSITQARIALASTDSGQDVQAALEILVSNGAAGGAEATGEEDDRKSRTRGGDGWESDGSGGHAGNEWDGEMREGLTGEGRGGARKNSQPQPPLRRDRQIAQDRARQRHSDRERELTSSSSSSLQQQNLQEQADKILAQASEIGLSLFNRANAAWKEGKVKVQKVYEERMGSADIEPEYGRKNAREGKGRGAGRQGGSARPKWMMEQAEFEDDGAKPEGGDDIAATPPVATRRRPEKNQNIPQADVDLFSAASDNGEKEVDLFSTSSPAPSNNAAASSTSTGTGVYVSRFRHGRPKPQPAASGSPPTAPAAPSKPHPTTLVKASPSSLSASQKHRLAGTSAFKLGDFPAAEAAYSRAIEALPEGHGLLVLLYNNRALARLKTGNSSGAQEDAGIVEGLVGGVGGVREEMKRGKAGRVVIKAVEEGKGEVEEEVNLGDALVKAWKRRAEALEGRERWDEAGKDWERVAGAEWAAQSIRGEGVRGAGRCRKMSNPPPKAPPASKPKSVPARPAPRRGPTPPSQALNTLRAANDAAESEDSEKHALKDTVDAKLLAWKGGKETNIRALLASLDTVLWPELGVQKLSMAELISEGQVKIKYMKAIAKVHPDKLNKGNSTVEQRMIAGGVFGALNEAWNAFKV